MKELLAGFAADVFRPIVTLLIPGFWLLTPWVVGILWHYPKVRDFAFAYGDACGLVFIVASTAVGFILEDLGSRLEELSSARHKHDKANWYSYLRLSDDDECIGTRYISSLVLRLKFELGMAAAGPICLGGLLWLPLSWQIKSVLCAIVAVITAGLACEGHSSANTLENARKQILIKTNASPPSNP